MKRTILIFVGLTLIALVFVGTALAVSTPVMERFVIAAGGGEAQNGSVILTGTIGQPITGQASGANEGICSGFWCLFWRQLELDYKIYQPVILRTN
ncbi:MAG: hypothetical protein JW862_17255 [Anaerolineales bacterium]|nr:hypothetical protein [Anaerolineales bacterium]